MTWKLRKARLEELGMTYREYLDSDLWIEAKRRHVLAGMPRTCTVCGDPWIQFHHITYQRLGKELPGDLLPLCKAHHEMVHEYARTHPTQLECIHKILRKITGWSRSKTSRILAPYNAGGVKDGWRNPSALTPRQRARACRKRRPSKNQTP